MASEISTNDIVSTLNDLNTELQSQGTIGMVDLLRFGLYLEPLRLALVKQFVAADNMTARLFVGYLFNSMEKLSEDEITKDLSPSLAFEYVVSFSAFINVCSKNAYKYVNLMGILGKVIALSSPILEECFNWVLLVSRPVIINIPSFVYDPSNSFVPKALFGDFFRKFLECFGLRNGFSYGGYQRVPITDVPLDTVGFILNGFNFRDPVDGSRCMNDEQLCKVLKLGSVNNPEAAFKSNPEVFIRMLISLMKTKSEEVLEHLLGFIFSTGVVKILADNYTSLTESVDELLGSVFQRTKKNKSYGEIIAAAELDQIKNNGYKTFARTLCVKTFSLCSTSVDWGHVYSVLGSMGRVESNKATLTAIGGVLQHLDEARSSPYISSSINQDWKNRIRRLLKLDMMKALAPFDVMLPQPEDVRLLYWMFVHFGDELPFLGRFLICRMGRLLEGNSLNALEGILEQQSTVLVHGIICKACLSSFKYPNMDQLSLIYTIMYYTATTNHKKYEQDIFLGMIVSKYLSYALLHGKGSCAPNYFRKLYESLDPVREYLNEPLLHELLYQQIQEAMSAARNRLDFVSPDFSGYVNYVQSRRHVGAACINELKSLL